jgi:hypothetical protein
MCSIAKNPRDRAVCLYSTLYTVQTSNIPCPQSALMLTWTYRKYIILGKLYQLCHLNNKYRY